MFSHELHTELADTALRRGSDDRRSWANLGLSTFRVRNSELAHVRERAVLIADY